ncbi:MAG: TatD family hydrolase [Dehalococcoidia bacterium]|nr:TatD family hydrolase [Dehalococcoidia bacterium]
MFNLIDTHAHLDMPQFDHDREEVIERAYRSGVTSIINVGTDIRSSEYAVQLARASPCIFAAVGFHPGQVASITESDIRQLAGLTRGSKVVAIGEIGLDYYRGYSSREVQNRVLEWQLEIASDAGLPVIVHCRRAEKDILATLTKWKSRNNALCGVIHCFSGSIEVARSYLDIGFYISLGAYIGYPTSRSNHETVRAIPLERLLLETDSPFLPPQSHRGRRNEPSYITATLAALAGIKGMPPDIIAQSTTANARRLFRLDQVCI